MYGDEKGGDCIGFGGVGRSRSCRSRAGTHEIGAVALCPVRGFTGGQAGKSRAAAISPPVFSPPCYLLGGSLVLDQGSCWILSLTFWSVKRYQPSLNCVHQP